MGPIFSGSIIIMEKMTKNQKIVAVGAVLLLFFMFGLTLRQDSILRQEGYRPSFLASALSIFDDSLFQNSTTNNNANVGLNTSVIPAPPAPGVITTLNTPALTKLGEGLFSSNDLYLYQGARYNLRVTLGENEKPAILKNYYINFVKDGIVYTMDARVEAPVTEGVFNSRILTVSSRVNGVLDVAAGIYDGYINTVWDTGTQTIKFNVTVLPAPIVVQPVALPTVIPQPLPASVPTPIPVILPVAPSLVIEQLAARDAYGVIQSGVYNYQNSSLWAYARVYTTGNGFVYNLSLVSRSNSSTQYYISSGAVEASGSRELSYPMPALNNIPTGVYDLTLIAAPRLPNGGVGGFVTRKEQITLVNDSNPISVIVPPVVVPPTVTGDGNVTVNGTVNLNTQNLISNRSCSEGGDAVNYSVLSLTANTAVLHMTPASGCLAVGDEVLLINLQGVPGYIGNVGNYELLRVKTISGSTVTFTTDKKRSYGATGDENIGTGSGNQKVMLQRVPNYNTLIVNPGAVLTANAFNGIRGGVLAFRVAGALNNNGKIAADGLGYRGGWTPGMQGEGRVGTGITVPHCASYSANYYGSGTAANDLGGGAHHCYGSGAGGSNATAGANGYGNALSGSALVVSNSSKLILGGGGGAAAGAAGGNGGGIVLMLGNSLNNNGAVSSNGLNSPGPCGVGTYTYSGGGGAGGSVYAVGTNLNIGAGIGVSGGVGYSCAYTGGAGGAGRFETASGL